MLKNKISLVILSLTLVLPLQAVPYDSVIADEQIPVVSTLDEDIVQNEVAPSQSKLAPESFKTPISKKKVAKKFLLAMLGVSISSFIIYFGLSIYNKIRDGVITADLQTTKDDKMLDTPESLSEAVKIFIDKTKWE